jgi:hypothetical protein
MTISIFVILKILDIGTSALDMPYVKSLVGGYIISTGMRLNMRVGVITSLMGISTWPLIRRRSIYYPISFVLTILIKYN